MNSIVQNYRTQNPQDTKSDEEIMDLYAQSYPQEQLAQYPDFLTDYQKIQQQRAVEQSSAREQLGSGFKRGMLGLESSAAGALALASSYLGANNAKDYWLDVYKRKLKQSAEEAPASVPKIEDATKSFSAAGQYVAGKAGELIPNVGEALVMAGAGTLVAPGPGTEAGAAGGFIARTAARTALRRLVEKKVSAEVRKELEDYALGKVAGSALSKSASTAIEEASKYIVGTGATAANFAALGAGGAYGDLSGREGVSEQAAREGALIAGAGASAGALIPGRILKGLFPTVSEGAAASYVDKYLVQVPKEIMTAAGGMGAMEFFNILAEKHADPKLRDSGFTKEDYSRMLNAIAVGVLASAPAVGITAAKSLKAETAKSTAEPGALKPPPAAEPGMTPKEVVAAFPVELSKEQILQLRTIAEKDVANTLSQAEKDYLADLPAVLRAQYETIKTEVANATKIGTEQKRVLSEREGADGQLQKAEEDRNKPPVQPEESAQASAGDSLQQAARELAPDAKEALKAKEINPEELKPLSEESKPAPPSTEQAPPSEAPSAAKVSEAKPPGVAAPEVPPAISEATTVPKVSQVSDTSWLSKVREGIAALRAPRVGHELEDMFSDLGRDAKNKGRTRALGVFRSKRTGKIIVASLYDNNGKKVFIRDKGRSWERTVGDGPDTFEPIEYIKTADPQEKFYREYTEDEWATLHRELEAKRDAAKPAAESKPEPTPAPKVEETPKAAAKPKAPAEVPSTELTGSDATKIHDLVLKHVGGLPKAEDIREFVGDALNSDPALVRRLSRIAGQDYDRFLSILDQIYGVYDKAAGSGETDPAKLREQVTSELAGIRPETPEGTAATGTDVPGPLQSRPEPTREPGRAELASVATHVLQRLQNAGISIRVLQGRFADLLNGFTQSMGSFERATRTINWALSDLSMPTTQDIRVLFEEVGHALFDRESHEARDAILKALSKLTERSPAEFDQVRRDVANAYPEGAPKGREQEELMMGWLSRKLSAEGFNPVQSRGIAETVVRLLKDLYLRASRWLQQTVLGRQYTNPDLALRYFENRLQSFMAGDQDILPWLDRMGGRKAPYESQVRWHTPIDGGRDTIQTFDPVTQTIETEPLVPDSVEAVMLNRGDDVLYSMPAPNTPPPVYVDRAIELNQQAAAVNEIDDLRGSAVQVGPLDAEQFRKANGLRRTEPIIGQLSFEAGEKQLGNYRPTIRLTDFTNERNIVRSYRSAVAWVKREIAKISDNTVRAKETKPKLEALRGRVASEYEKVIDNYKDAGFMSDLIKRGFRKILYQDIRNVERVGKALGVSVKQFQDIEGTLNKPVDPAVVNALRRLYTGDALQGEKLFDILNFMANDPGINWSDRASLIRFYIKDRAENDPTLDLYGRLASDTPDAKALLSTVIAYGKLNQKEVALLQMRSMASGERRAQLEQELKDLRKQTNDQLVTGIQSVAKTAGFEAIARNEHRKTLRYLTRLNRALEQQDNLIAANERALPVYQARLDTLGGKISRARDVEFQDGMTIALPKTLEAKPQWEEKEVILDSSRGQVTSSAEFQAMGEHLATWLKLRELAFLQGDTTALGFEYQNAKRQLRELVKNRLYDHVLHRTDALSTQLVFSPAPKRFEALGTPSSGLLGRIVNRWVADTKNMANESDKLFGFHNSRLENQLLGIVNQGRKGADKVTAQWLTRYLLNKAVGFMDDQQYTEGGNRAQELEAAYGKLQDYLLRHESIRNVIGDRLPQFMEAFKRYDESLDQSDAYWFGKLKAAGELVKDRKLKDELRVGYRTGMRTRARKFSDMFFNLVHSMRAAGWETTGKDQEGIFGDIKNVADAYAKGGAAAVHALMDKYYDHTEHGDTIRADFLYGLTHLQKESVIETPVLDDSGATMEADPAEVARAYDEAGGDVVGMFERLHDYYNGQDARADYIQKGMQSLAETFKEMSSALRKVEPKGNAEVMTLSGIIPNIMINAREFEHWPSEWFEYHKFDRNDNARIAERVSGTVNFGRDASTLSNVHLATKAETDSMVAKLNAALDQAERMTPSGKKTAKEKEAAKILAKDTSPMLARFKTGEERLRYLRQVEKASPYVQSFVTDMWTHFNRHNQETGSLRWGIRFAQELASLLVNQPGSAISQLATMFDIPVQWGASPTMLKATARAIQMTGKDIAGSLAQGIGWEFLKTSYYEDRFNRLNLNDPETARRMGDIFGTLTGEENRPASRAFRIARDIQSATMNLRGEEARYTPLRPGAPFFQFVNASNRALFVALSEMADGYISKGIDYLRTHPGETEITGESLGLRGLERNSFDLWRKDHARYGLDYVEMVKGAMDRMRRGDRIVLTDQELSRINAVALNAISLESNIATMPLWAFNNNIVRFGLPLLGWSFRRALQVTERIGAPTVRGLRNLDKEQLKNVSLAALGLAATGLGGLGLSLVVDAYQEDVVGKKRNIRELRIPTTGQDWVGIQERLNRVGTFGLWGDFLNGAVNIGTGQGDNRMLSVDQRVVALQSFLSLQKAISNFINEDFDPNYRDVVRPVISSLGGQGLLQYAQIVNHAFDLDNVESRVVKRINAENYLRVTGRDLGMSIRTSGGAYNTPTPITPWIARMEYAAYANDPSDFRAAYRGALDEARKAGKADPADYVKKAFETRHPIRYVFAQMPSENEYRQVLANMDERGQESVEEAVRLFNYYGAHLGLTPYEGSRKKAMTMSPDRIAAARERALSALAR